MKPRMPHNTSRGNPDNIHKMLLLSLIIHLVVITVLFISVPSSSRRLTFGPIYSVQLVGSSEIASSIESSLLKDILQQREEDANSNILKREMTSISSMPVKKEETSSLNVEKAIDAIKQKDLSRQTTSAPTDKSNSNASSVSGGTMTQAQATAANEYIAVIWSRVKGNWTLPAALMPKDNIEAIIDVKISRNGTLEHMELEKSSGNSYFDDSAIKAVKKSIPFPPLPYYIPGNHIEIGIRFHPKELR